MTDDIYETPSSTPNFQTELAEQLAELVPEAVADGKIDVLKLQELLAQDASDTSERFGLFWPGKQRALRTAQIPTTATLRPEPERSKDWDTTKNVFIEGDNLEVLKILQKHYHGKIKMIYIDPPYNTGKEFVYPDNFKEGLENYLEWTQQVADDGKKLSTNSETDGRYHSNWLTMMYPRLKLARNLLSHDGVIAISIDDHEQDNLKKLCNEIFGEQNFVAQLVWNTKEASKGVPPTQMVTDIHEYVLVYSRSGDFKFNGVKRTTEAFSNPDDDPRGVWRKEAVVSTVSKKTFEIIDPTTGHRFNRAWAFSPESMQRMIAEGKILFPAKETGTPLQKKFFNDYTNEGVPITTQLGTFQSRKATSDLMRMFEGEKLFDFPKPVDLLKFLVEQSTGSDDIILDFFAGSATLGHAVFQLNSEQSSSRNFILVQLPEPTAEESDARRAGYKSISELSRRRLEIAGQQIIGNGLGFVDVGFRSYRLVNTNFEKWSVESDVDLDRLEQHLFSMRDSADDESKVEYLLVEVLIKLGYSLSEIVTSVMIAELQFSSVGDGLILAYMDESKKPNLVGFREALDHLPSKLIILEDAFQGDDELKTNLAQLCKSKNIELWTA